MTKDELGDPTKALVPPPESRYPITTVDSPHPALLSSEVLLEQCDWRFQRRSGPGGQHRNKTSSGAFLHHPSTGLVSEATERRSQADNRAVALTRLRFRLAVQCRTASVIDQVEGAMMDDLERSVREEFCGSALQLNAQNPKKPSLLALVLNDMHASGGQPSLVRKIWSVSTSSLTKLLKSHPPAFALVNAIREHHGRGPLK